MLKRYRVLTSGNISRRFGLLTVTISFNIIIFSWCDHALESKSVIRKTDSYVKSILSDQIVLYLLMYTL